jgi:small-conductance mechanosensitive channel
MGLAAKEVVSNFFGGAVLLITRPFVIGDRIKAGSFAGLVQDIGYLQTKILGFDGVPILVPNQAFINQVINNMSRATSRSLEAEFLLQNQNIFMVEKITERVTEYLYMNSHVDSKRTRPLCYLKDISQAGPKIAIMCNINLLVS